MIPVGILLSNLKGAWDSSDEWNQLLLDCKFNSAEGFLGNVWEDRE